MEEIKTTAPQLAAAIEFINRDSIVVRKDHYGALAIAALESGSLSPREIENIGGIYAEKMTMGQLVELCGLALASARSRYGDDKEYKAACKVLAKRALQELAMRESEPDAYLSDEAIDTADDPRCPICNEWVPLNALSSGVCPRCGAVIWREIDEQA